MYSRLSGGAGSDDGIDENSQFRGSCVDGFLGGRGCRRTRVGEIVVVFDGLEGGAFAEEAKVVDWDRGGEEGVYRCDYYISIG